jgi:hypothetical protein
LNKWRRHRIPVQLFVVQDDGNKSYYRSWVGTISSVNDYGYKDIHLNEDVDLTMKVERTFDNFLDLGWYEIIGVSGNIISIDGYFVHEIPLNTKLYIDGSTANDGLKAVTAVSYDSVNNETDITVSPSLVDGSTDGRIQIWDRP